MNFLDMDYIEVVALSQTLTQMGVTIQAGLGLLVLMHNGSVTYAYNKLANANSAPVPKPGISILMLNTTALLFQFSVSEETTYMNVLQFG